ncbi:30S ribosomal protein S8e [Candidatus Woesearchaeota archaeon]|nr:MAG: 30S ribosomal protein S8e [Candidatus Woesearchaeota archaeon]
MAISQKRSRRKVSGGKYNQKRKVKQYELGGRPVNTTIGKFRKNIERVLGGNTKTKLLRTEFANVYDPKAKKTIKAKIVKVVENPANRFFARRNIITKGAIIETEKGVAVVTSRPGQDGCVNAKLQ